MSKSIETTAGDISSVSYAEYKTTSYLKTSEDIEAYLNAVLEENDSELLMLALRHIADVKDDIVNSEKRKRRNQ